ncbi:MAG: sulfotransferase family 2 domain-containing protein [Caldilineales bacterium]|nr:sulfotransferase family 2 domain-containing protein [Caldilineales bacterium]
MPAHIGYQLHRLAYALRHPRKFRRLQRRRHTPSANGYCYKPFDELDCIYVHIPRCAGVSVTRSLFGGLAGGHTTLAEYQIVFGPGEFQRYFKFTFVRNPWDRLVSAFFYLKAGGFSQWDAKWAEENLAVFSDFNMFVREWLNETNIKSYYHFFPQSHYVCTYDGSVGVDFAGRFENLAADFQHVCDVLGIRAMLTESNKSERADYRSYYDEETKRIVADVYAQDIELFGYSF